MLVVTEAVKKSWQRTLLGCCMGLLLDAFVMVSEAGLHPRAGG